MSTHRKVVWALCASAVTLALGAAVASADTVELSNPGSVTLTSSSPITFTAGVTVRCNVSLTGTFNSGITQSRGQAIASVTRATASGCSGGERPSVTFLSLPWSLTYNGVSGTWPEELTAMQLLLNGVNVSIASSGLTCLYRGEVGLESRLTGPNPYELGDLATLSNRLSLVSGGGCASTASVSGTFTDSVDQWIGGQVPLPLQASPRFVRSEEAQTDKTVTWTNVEINNTIAEIGTYVDTAAWSASIGNCTFAPFIAPTRRCTITVRTSVGTEGTFRLYREAPGGIPTGPRGTLWVLPEP